MAHLSLVYYFVLIFFTSLFVQQSNGYSSVRETLHFGDVGSFILIADIHYDPFYDPAATPASFCRSLPQLAEPSKECAKDALKNRYQLNEWDQPSNTIYGQYGCDIPASFLTSTVEAVAHIQKNLGSDFLMLAGDSVGHCIPDSDQVLQALETVTSTLRSKLPRDFPVLTSLGNNDLFPHNALPTGPSEYLEHVADIWKPWIQNENGTVPATFLNGGFYSYRPVEGLKVLVLNTVYLMDKWTADNQTITENSEEGDDDDDEDTRVVLDDPAGQFAWMEEELQQAVNDNESVYILSHVAPGASRTLKKDMTPELQKKFLEVTAKYSSVIKSSFFGHNHRSMVSLQLTKHKGKHTNLNTMWKENSVTPKDFSNPSFSVVYFDRNTFQVLDRVSYYVNFQLLTDSLPRTRPQWLREYSFATDVNNGEVLSDEVMLKLFLAAKEDPVLLSPLRTQWASHSAWAVGFNEMELRCAMEVQTPHELKKCLKHVRKSWKHKIRSTFDWVFNPHSWVGKLIGHLHKKYFNP